jgi:hypothetical protein
MASILGRQVTSWPKGVLDYTIQGTGLIEPSPGFDGYAVAGSGYRRAPQEISTITVLVGDIAAVETLCLDYHGLSMQMGTIVDQFGRIFDGCIVMSAIARPVETVITGTYWIVTEWRVMLPTIRPAAPSSVT